MALDTLESLGFKANVNFFDAGKNDSATIAKILTSEAMGKQEIVIGPILKNAFYQASLWSAQRNVPIISPFSNAHLDNDNNPNSIYFAPSVHAYAMAIQKLSLTLGPEVNLVYVGTGTAEDTLLYTNLKKLFVNRQTVSCRKR
jgi:hypothetical protein